MMRKLLLQLVTGPTTKFLDFGDLSDYPLGEKNKMNEIKFITKM